MIRNDIYRKFENQFASCFLNCINIEESLYVEESTDEYAKALDTFIHSKFSDIKFFVGYTGVGKTTFLKHYFSYRTIGISYYKKNAVVVPLSWDGKKISDNEYKSELDLQICNVLYNLIKHLCNDSYEELIINECEEIYKYIIETRNDIITSLDIDEILEVDKSSIGITLARLKKSQRKSPVEFASSLLKYALEKKQSKIKKIIFILDDLETLAQYKLCYLITRFLKIYDCLHNMKDKKVIKLLISMRPHSYRFLKNGIEHKYVNVYGNFLNNDNSLIMKNSIPNIRDILINRFNSAFDETERPGNPTTWNTAKRVFFDIIASMDGNMVQMVSELCHLNIRAIIDCLQMILSNRVWCQNTDDFSEYPNVRFSDYRFDIVNVVRTLACGEMTVYTGKKDVLFNMNNTSNVMSRPCFDGSDIFLPNLLIDLDTKKIDILSLILIIYLDGFFSSSSNTPLQTEYISRKDFRNNILSIFGEYTDVDKINKYIDYLFNNRIIRKSIISEDSDDTINVLTEEDYIYLTLKGNRMLLMLESDSVLIEIFREDIRRKYEDSYYKSSFELITENNRTILFDDLINLAGEVYANEDNYQRNIKNDSVFKFYNRNFPVTQKIINGIENSLKRSQNIDIKDMKNFECQLNALKVRVDKSIREINGGVDYNKI